jgi:putative ABC transport system permease protein
MTSWTLIRRSLWFHRRAHFGVALGAAVGSAALIGALLVGDSVRGSLTDMALARLGKTQLALVSNDRFFRSELADAFNGAGKCASAAVMELPGTASAQDASARANRVQVLGVDEHFWRFANQSPAFSNVAPDSVVLNQALAEQLKSKIGDTILLRVQKPSLLSRDAPISPQEDSAVALRLKVQAVVSPEQLGGFGLQANQVAPFNAFVNLAALQTQVAQKGRANLMLLAYSSRDSGTNEIQEAAQSLRQNWQLADAELEVRELPDGEVELRTDRVFLDPAAVDAARKVSSDAQSILTYFVNELRDGNAATPYSMVTAMGAPIVPPEMKDDEILVNDWLAGDLQAKVGDSLALTYFVIGNGRALEERTNSFRLRGIVPLAGAAADRSLMPDFPGLARAESSSDWDAGFPINLKRIRPKDEQYWKEHRGTPKAFVTLAAGKQMWANRFGDYTAVRFPKSAGTLEQVRNGLRQNLDPSAVGLGFQPVRETALAATAQVVPFGELFLGFSFFLIAAALLLMALLFQFGLEQRATEVGVLLALGLRPAQVRRLLLIEGVALAFVGGIAGALGGIVYAKVMLRGLTTIWRGAVGTSSLQYHAQPETLAIGTFAAAAVAVITLWLALRRQARQPARELLAEGASEWSMNRAGKRSRGIWVGIIAGVAAIGMLAAAFWQGEKSTAETFFSAGSLMLIAGLGFSTAWLATRSGTNEPARLTIGGLGLRGCARRRKRSVATIGLLACGAFLIVAVDAFRQDANQNATARSSGTGGFAFIGESALPITYDLNGRAGRDFYGLNAPQLADVKFVAFRVRDGDEASCLNLNRALQPPLLGVNPDELQKRGAFTFADAAKGMSGKGWAVLKEHAGGEIPAVGDENSIQWAMGKKIGDTLDYTDERGRPFKVRLAGAVANSILQGSLIIDEAEFVKRFPGESGYRMFLVDAPSNVMTNVTATLSRALQDAGLELTGTAKRLNAFNAVQNTYLSTFEILGGLGLLLGSAGLGVVVLRNVQERRGELALILAVGWRRGALQRLVLIEHGALLGLGLAVGLAAAAIAVLPALLSSGSQIPYATLTLTLAAVLANGLVWTWLATRFALRGRLLDALRNE